jgi:predicted AlkP superfamily phosphohydrolase/phosphomutase/Tfp pilus assembly protein PilF
MASNEPKRRRKLSWNTLAALGVLVWLCAGIRVQDPRVEFGVLDGILIGNSSMSVTGKLALAPPGLLTLYTYPRQGVELALPQAEDAMLLADDGSRYGYRGWITVRARPESWEVLHQAAAGRGLRGALLHAVKAVGPILGPGSPRGPLPMPMQRDFRLRLNAELTKIGLDQRRLDLDSIDFLSVVDGYKSELSSTKLLVIGLDGADWEIMDPLMAAGKLPNLERLVRTGARAKLLSISPMLSPVIWTTVATGVEPSRHGIIDFLIEDPETGGRQPVTSAQRQVPTVWEILSRSGLKVGIVAWWASWPADPLRGYLVSDRLAYQLFGYRSDPDDSRGKTWPPDLYEEIRPLITAPDHVLWNEVVPYLSGPRSRREEFGAEEQELLDGLRTLIASGETYLSIADTLSQQMQPDLEVVYFEGTDTVGHMFMPYRLPALPGVDQQRIDSFSNIVDRYYETADRYVGQLLEGHGEEWTVMVLSDHGFASDATRPRSTDSRIGHGGAADWHRRFGALILSGDKIASGGKIDEASVYDIAPTIMALFGQPIPRSWPGTVLGQVFSPEFLEEHPVVYRMDDPVREDNEARAQYDDPAAAELLEKLQSLGYISAETGGTDSMTARNNVGVTLLAEHRYAEAEAEFRAGLKAQPGSPMLLFNLGVSLRLQGKEGESIQIFEKCLGFQNTRQMAGHMLAQYHLGRDELVRAEELVREVLKVEPDDAELLNDLGLVLEKQGDIAGATDVFRRAADLDPDAAMSRNNLGNLSKRSGDAETAESWYLRAIEADPYFMGAYNNLALVYQERGELDKAIDLYSHALSKSPNSAVVLNNLGSLYYATDEADEARKLWARAAQADPSYPSPLNNLAGLAINNGRFDEAELLLRDAIVLDDTYGDARINLAIVLRENGNIEDARHQLEKATGDPRAAANSWLQLGFMELETGYVDNAITALERALINAPRDFIILNGLGEARRIRGETNMTLTLWRRSLTINPNQPQLRQSLKILEQMANDQLGPDDSE